ncbi:molybdopterin-dependent oxidoreductase [Phaeobacter gallaeciensis]|uniref:Molybdopterin-dependent oxidoreductase n=1 Tax=Phaeobacter gallaeciensis TaxID=60890 RepID=A0ABD4X910_9RHOB|nr:molybdopterin-dependent oxidoreductase [Phaeobacter gallaeciensis]MDE4144497.1 molybdopterin-dependent oxidoreductase [Phaeobacter gallaeciensis]MDE4157462.1 molybdopterin-dependent oxidoreductase [Phaeobacter gallaeciensis]MDE4161649.1 molybdopterin-dependent oxidoreductase [Phaeobacter gallaeciensis]MDE4165871.1 molybdopterin-dependent oxidoreductase [Phaeobacter gallaeciensis]MDE4170113.1 molybdopterin-dependent oxidoreductase [Phaeobacter gallaeciensis]
MTNQDPTAFRPSVCPLDCPDTCSLSVKVEGGKISEVRGSTANPFTAGVICNKVARCYPDFVHGAARLRHPLKRTGPRGSGAYERITWEEALDLIHAGFNQAIEAHGPQSVLPLNYAGPHGELAGGSMDRRFFYRMGATLLDRGPLCGGVRGEAYASLFGSAPGMPPEQAVKSDLILVWGNNVTVSNLHFMRVIKEARKSGARVVVIDPKRIKLAEQCDMHLQLRPGTDVVLALGLAAELERRDALDMAFIGKWTHGFDAYMEEARAYTPDRVAEICGLPAEELHQLVDWIVASRRMASSFGNGIERTRSGGAGLRAAMALNALTGHHGRLGAGVVAKSGAAAPKTTARLQADHLIRPGTRCFNIVDVAEKMLDRSLDVPVGAVMIYNHNPVATHPDQDRMIEALTQEDLFIAGADVVMTDSMAFCDVILPAASHFEYDDIYGAYGQNYIQRAEPVIAPVGESLPNTEIFRRLAARFGYQEREFRDSDKDLMDQAMDASHPVFGGKPPSEMSCDQAIALTAGDGSPLVLCHSVMPQTPSGRIELFNQDLEDRFGCGVPRYDPAPQDLPLVLVTPSSDKRTNATFGHHALSAGAEVVQVHPQDAEARGLSHGDPVTVWNARGEVTFTLEVTTATRPGVVYSPKGTWLSSSRSGRTANALIPSALRTDIAGGACYNETFVDLRRGWDSRPD